MPDEKNFWTCQNCNEQIESNLEVCWNCQHDRSGTVPPSFASLEIADRAQKEALSDKWQIKQCIGCHNRLTYVGTKDFHEGPRLGLFGDLGEFFVSQTKLEMYYCPTCGRVEFFVPPAI